jgi:hypothetical protein
VDLQIAFAYDDTTLDDMPTPPALMFALVGSKKSLGYGELQGRFIGAPGATSSTAMRAHLSKCLKALLRQAADSSTLTIQQLKLSDVPSTAVVQFNQVDALASLVGARG